MTQKVKNLPRGRFLTHLSDNQTVLFELYFSAYFFELSLHSFSFSLSEAFFYSRGSTVYDFFSFLEAKTGEFLHELNHFEFFTAGSLEDYVERCFLFSSCTGSGRTGCNSYSSSGGFDAVFFLEDLGKFVYFLDSEVYELFSKSF